MDAVSAITQDHRLLEQLFQRVEQAREERPQLIEQITARLSAHSVAEEIHVYPELEKNAPGEAEEVHEGVAEHRQAEEKLAAAQSASEEQFDTAFKEFVAAVSHHVEEEETELLPALQKALTPQRLEELGAEFEQRRVAELEDWEHPDT